MHFYIVDCFAEEKYQGNQLAVFILTSHIKKQKMQSIAKEIGFSESSFVDPQKNDDGSFNIRIFTPDAELPFAGHPVIGTAFIVRNFLDKDSDDIKLNMPVGQICVKHKDDMYTMLQNQPLFGETLSKGDVAPILNLREQSISDDLPIQWVSTGLSAIIVPVNNLSALQSCRINNELMKCFIDQRFKSNILVFCVNAGIIRVRVFMDDEGFLEDAATGSANGNLAAYLVENNFFRSNKVKYIVEQGIEMGRGSKLYINVEHNEGIYAIYVGGKVCLIANGEWNE